MYVYPGYRFACNQCDQKYVKPQSLAVHVAQIHEKRQDFECKPCGKTFAAEFQFYSHNWQVHSKKTCDICNKEISNTTQLKRHKVFVHNETKGVWLCEKCPKKVFFTKNCYGEHLAKKHM